MHTNIYALIRELSGPPTALSGRGYGLQTEHLESRCHGHFVRNPRNLQNYGFGRDCNPTCFNATICWHCLDARLPSPIGVRDVGVPIYCGANLGYWHPSRKVIDSYCLRTVTHYSVKAQENYLMRCCITLRTPSAVYVYWVTYIILSIYINHFLQFWHDE